MASLSRSAATRMDETLPWYRALSAEDRSWVGLVAQAGIGAFVAWLAQPDGTLDDHRGRLRHGAARADPVGHACARRWSWCAP